MDPSLCQGALGEIMADEVPVIDVGYKLDLRDEHNPWSFEQMVAPLMQQYKEIETFIECSASNLAQILYRVDGGDIMRYVMI
ncbi:hypothetical protein Tco_0677971 [Tanacetum coccineum]|uniref:Uncharacterized protein n=1 Tax=Tanacetum coccineum TaxID=301880 RepID=A0ABQ4XDP2_9ASTR